MYGTLTVYASVKHYVNNGPCTREAVVQTIRRVSREEAETIVEALRNYESYEGTGVHRFQWTPSPVNL